MAKANFLVKIILAVAFCLILLSLGVIITMTPEPKTKVLKNKDIGVNVQGSNIGGDFVLIDSSGKEVSSESLRGKLLLVYFGFTYCPDICPASLVEMVSALDEVEKYSKDLQAIFITIDPKRDTPQELNKYFKNFDARIMALTGTDFAIDEVAKKFRVYYSIADDGAKNTPNYLVNHSSFYYLIGKDGKLIKYYSPGVNGKEMGKNILKYHLR